MSFDTREKSVSSGEPVYCFRFEMSGTIWRMTSADSRFSIDVLSEGLQPFTPGVISAGEIEYSGENEQGSVEIRLERSHPIALLSAAGAPIRPVIVQIWALHAGETEIKPVFDGEISSVSFEDVDAVLACESVFAVLKRRVPTVPYQTRCPWPLYSAAPKCGLNELDFEDSGTVTAFSGATVTAAIFGTRPDGRYVSGKMKLTNGDLRYIVKHVGTLVTLRSSFPALSIGTTFKAYRGCKHTETDCTNEFSNIIHFGGDPRIPSRNPLSQRIV